MRKFIIYAMIATLAVLVYSCNSKKENKVPLTDTLVSIEKNGKFGVQTTDGVSVVGTEYESVAYNEQLNVISANAGDATVLFSTTGYQLVADKIARIDPTDVKGFFRVTTFDQEVYLIRTDKDANAWGKFKDIRQVGEFLFFLDEDGWGAATTNHKGLAPRRFENVYIVNNGTTCGVLVKNRDGWALYDKDGVSDGIQYDLSNKELTRQLKKLKLPETPYGVVEVNWDL